MPLPLRGVGNPTAVIQQSRLHYGMLRKEVEKKLLKILRSTHKSITQN
jgi:hypothetical protein